MNVLCKQVRIEHSRLRFPAFQDVGHLWLQLVILQSRLQPDPQQPVEAPRVGDSNAALNRGRKRLSPSPPSEPGVRFSRDGLSSQLFPHRDWRANRWASDIVNSPRLAKKTFGHCL